MTLAPEEFIRRFLLHTLPSGFQRIRHYGLFSSRNKNTLLELCRLLLAEAASLLPSPQQLKEVCRALTESAAVCPACQVGRMVRIDVVEVSSFATVRWQSVWGRPSVCLPASSIAPLPALRDSVGLLVEPHHRSLAVLVRHSRHSP